MNVIRVLWVVLAAAALALAQTSPAAPSAPLSPDKYMLGPGDDIVVKALNVDEIKETPTRLDMQGDIKIPLVGKVHAAGLTAEDLENVLKGRLAKYLHEPEVIVTVITYRSQPVMVLGAVTNPGVHQLEGRKTLFEVISAVGGVKPDAGHNIKITREKNWGPIPLPGALEDPTGRFYVAEVSLKSVTDAKNPADNIEIRPRDIITVPKVQLIYVIGAVKKAGGYALGDSESVTVLQALALAEGLDRMAAPTNARIMRMTPGGASRTEIPVDVKKIFNGKGTDVALGAEDILFIPNNGKKAAMLRSAEAALTIGSGIAIYSVRP